MNDYKERYIIPKCGSAEEARLTRHYIVTADGKIALRLKGSTKTRIIHAPEDKGYRYHVQIYLGIIRKVSVFDMLLKELVHYKQENISQLLTQTPAFLRPILVEEIIGERDP